MRRPRGRSRSSICGNCAPLIRNNCGRADIASAIKRPLAWGVEQARHRCLRTNRLAALAETRSSTVTDLAHPPHESRDVPRVDGLIHRADTHRPRALRARATRPPPPPNRSSRSPNIPPPHGRRNRSSRPFRTTPRRGGSCGIATPSTGKRSGAVSPAWAFRRSSPVPQALGKTHTRRD